MRARAAGPFLARASGLVLARAAGGVALVVACVVGLGGCRAHTEERAGVWHAAHTSYRLGALGGHWQRHPSDADLSFYDPDLDAMIMVNSECPAEHDAPLKVAANTLLLGFTDRELLVDEPIEVGGREGLHRRLRAKLDGAPLMLDLVVLKKDECLYDLVYLAPPATAGRGEPDFLRLVAGFDPVEGERMARRQEP